MITCNDLHQIMILDTLQEIPPKLQNAANEHMKNCLFCQERAAMLITKSPLSEEYKKQARLQLKTFSLFKVPE